MKIGDLARVAHCTVETIRYYEKQALLPAPERTAGNFRVYGPAHVERLRFIRNCRALGMSHDEIHTLLGLDAQAGQGCAAVNEVFDQHMAHVDERIRELTHLKQQLATLRMRCQTRPGDTAMHPCGILSGLAGMEVEPKTQRHTHLG